ncbi:hypothetical protein [Salininema proteolyticum]|uniref:Uncharacterized protein n=1 Tax=Salininema proteolyticum TaxID=1607685 RepID=A0ABV8TWM3_9ACTN
MTLIVTSDDAEDILASLELAQQAIAATGGDPRAMVAHIGRLQLLAEDVRAHRGSHGTARSPARVAMCGCGRSVSDASKWTIASHTDGSGAAALYHSCRPGEPLAKVEAESLARVLALAAHHDCASARAVRGWPVELAVHGVDERTGTATVAVAGQEVTCARAVALELLVNASGLAPDHSREE